MKKIIFIIFTLFLIIFLIGLFLSYKKSLVKVINKQQELKIHPLSTSSLITTSTLTTSTSTINLSNLALTLELQKQINQEVNKLTANLTPDTNKSISQYQQEIKQAHQDLNLSINSQNFKPEIFINLAKKLTSVRPPTIFYSFHLELIKTYYTLGYLFQEFEKTNDPVKKTLLYNLIKTTSENIKP
jgi:hypothetical protein